MRLGESKETHCMHMLGFVFCFFCTQLSLLPLDFWVLAATGSMSGTLLAKMSTANGAVQSRTGKFDDFCQNNNSN